MRLHAQFLALAITLGPGVAVAAEQVGSEDEVQASKGPLRLRLGAGGHYGRNAGGVLALLGLGLGLNEELEIYAEGELGVGQIIGHPGDARLNGAAVALRAGPLMVGLQHRTGGDYTLLGALVGAFFELGTDPGWGLGLRLVVGEAPGMGLDWSLRASFELESWFQ